MNAPASFGLGVALILLLIVILARASRYLAAKRSTTTKDAAETWLTTDTFRDPDVDGPLAQPGSAESDGGDGD